MNPRIEALLAVEPDQLDAGERADVDAALAADDEALETAIALLADGELADVVGDPFATDTPTSSWRSPAEIGAGRKRRWPAIAIAAAILVAAAVAIAMFVQSPGRTSRERIAPAPTPAPTVVPDEKSPRPAPMDGVARPHIRKVIATFQADTATIDLVGVEVASAVELQSAFPMTLYWRVRTPFPEDPIPSERWRVFVHFDGHGSRFQADHGILADGEWWLTGDIVEDRFPVMAGRVSRPYPAGTYDIFVGWFKGQPGAWTNATFSRTEGRVDPRDDNRLHIGQIELLEADR